MSLEVEIAAGMAGFSAAEWDACACPEAQDGARPIDPFTTHRFLSALEQSGSVGPGTGWEPRMLSVRDGARLIAVAPLYAKHHSQGEYVFDHAWADAYMRAGGDYYPKLQIAVPFTPVTGRRLLTRPGEEARGRAALIQGAVQLAADNRLSSLHVTFPTEEEARTMAAMGLIHRIGEQFHWLNRDYADFDAFLADLSSRKRKAIRRERRRANGFGGDIVALTGGDLTREHMDAFWQFYQDTGARKWGRPYLTRAFFDIALETMAGDMLLVLARRGGRWVAGALNFIGREALFGRWWGAIEHHDCLHFELCYYRAIDWAIAQGLSRVEAGAQGEHKIARGYLPVATHSAHWIADAGFRAAVEEFVTAEARAVGEDIDLLTQMGPFRRTDPGPRD
ncbi:MAG TPA: N-acetyltransferase [Aliiroseovarius sp.]|nr:N-acetyltransferase [Aliiroseovarius sp.]